MSTNAQTPSIWEVIKNYYAKKGSAAWKEIPFKATSNPFIAKYYAELVARYVKEAINNGKINRNETIYILELGAGLGTFAAYFNKIWPQIIKYHDLEELNFCYVITDGAKNNVKNYNKQKRFQPYIDAGTLDTAVFDINNLHDITLTHKNTELFATSKKNNNPLIMISNYVIDSLRTDFFFIENNELFPGNVSYKSEDPKFNPEYPKNINSIKITIKQADNPIATPAYEEEYLNKIIAFYLAQKEDFAFSLPVTYLRMLDFVREKTGNSPLYLAIDHGEGQLAAIKNQRTLNFGRYLDNHVNFHSITHYYSQQEADYLMIEETQDLAMFIGFPFAQQQQLPLIKDYLHITKYGGTPSSWPSMLSMLMRNSCNWEGQLRSIMRWSNYDTSMLAAQSGGIVQALEENRGNPVFQKEIKLKYQEQLKGILAQEIMDWEKPGIAAIALKCNHVKFACKLYKELAEKSDPENGYNHLVNLKTCYEIMGMTKEIDNLRGRFWTRWIAKKWFEIKRDIRKATKLLKDTLRGILIIAMGLIALFGFFKLLFS